METFVNLSQKEKQWVIIFYIEWKLDETNTDDIFNSIYKNIWSFSWKKIILNLKKLEYLNSKAIWYIVDLFANLEEDSWAICISDCQDKIYDIFELTWVIEVIPYSKTEKEALEKLK